MTSMCGKRTLFGFIFIWHINQAIVDLAVDLSARRLDDTCGA